MKTVREWIDQLGRPPADICIDWAWQLRQLEQTFISSRHQAEGLAGGPKQLSWEDLLVDPQGMLLWPPIVTESHAGADVPSRTTESLTDGRHAVSVDSLFIQVLEWLREDTARDSSYEPSPEMATETTGASQTRAQVVRNVRRRVGEAGGHPAQPHRRASQGKRTFEQTSRSVWLVSVASMTLAGLLFWQYQAHWRLPAKMTSPMRSANLAETVDQIGSAENGSAEEGSQASSPINGPQAAVPSLSLLADRNSDSPGEDPVDPDGMLDELGQLGLQEIGRQSPQFGDSEPWTASKSSPAESDEGENVSGQSAILAEPNRDFGAASPNNSTTLAEDSSVDVLAEVVALTEESTAEEHPVQVADSEVDSNSTMPIKLSIFPMWQTHRLGSGLSSRPSQPVWKLRLIEKEGLSVQPSVPQLLERGKMVQWLIQPDEVDEITTRVAVRVRMLGSRGTDLRWGVAAVNSEFPQLSLPLNRKFLDRVQRLLLEFQTRLKIAEQQVSGLRASSGLSSAARSILAAQKAAIENQSEMAKGLLEVASDANQLVGWLDEQLEVPATLFDGTGQDSTLLLQFGEVQTAQGDEDGGLDSAPSDSEPRDAAEKKARRK